MVNDSQPRTTRRPDSETTPGHLRMAIAITAALLLGCVMFWAPDASRCDFGAMYVAGYMVDHGAGAKTYDLAEQGKYQHGVVGRHTLLPFPYPPFSAALFAALAVLPYHVAYMLWDVFSLILWVSFVLLMRSYAPVPQNTFRFFLVCFTFWPCWIVLLQGQTSLVVLLAYALTFQSLRRGREQRAGAFLGLGLLKYHFVMPFVVICALRRRWRLLLGFTPVALALAVVSAGTVGWAGLISYEHLMLAAVRDPALLAVHTQDWLSPAGILDALSARRAGAGWPRLLGNAVSVLLILLAAWRWRKEDLCEDGGRQDLAFAAALAVTVVVTSHLLFHDLSLLLLPLLLAMGSPDWRAKPVWRFVLVASVAGLYIPPLWVVLVDKQWLYMLCPALLAFTLAVFALLGRPERTAATAGDATPLRGGSAAATTLPQASSQA